MRRDPQPSATTVANACIRCGRCQPVCPVGLLPDLLLAGCNNTAPLDTAALSACIECAKCNQACPSHINLVADFRRRKQSIQLELQAAQEAELAKARFARHQERIEQRAQARQQRRLQRLQSQRDW